MVHVQLPKTLAAVPMLHWRDELESTNTTLRELVAAGSAQHPPHGTLVATDNQVAGRGRLGRDWSTEPGLALATSVLIRGFGHPGERQGSLNPADNASNTTAHNSARNSAGHDELPLSASWLPLIAGSAMVRVLQPFFTGHENVKRVGVKWPNDVHVRTEHDAMNGNPGLKLCGILCEVLPDSSIIVGAGVNVLLEEWQLPTERATSLRAAGAAVGDAETLRDAHGQALADDLLSQYVTELLRLVQLAHDTPDAVRKQVVRDSLTVGAQVRVHLPGDAGAVDGFAVTLDPDGALIVDRPTTGQLVVNAADVEHLR